MELQNLLYPLCGFLNKLQKDTASLYEVIYCFAFIYVTKIFNEYIDSNFSEKMVERMKKCWKQQKQPLLILSIVLHPSYRVSKFWTSIPNLSIVHLEKQLKYYYKAWFSHKSQTILAEFMQYMKGLDPYDDDSFAQFQGQLIDFQEFTSGIGNDAT